MAEDTAVENAKKAVAEDRKVVERSHAEFAERTKGKPTPTQEENDLAMHGGFVVGSEHESDGASPDPHVKSLEADKRHSKPQTYQTRESKSSAT